MTNNQDPELPAHNNNDELFLSEYGTMGKGMALGVKGSKQFLLKIENLLINYGVIGENARYHPLFGNFGYFVINPDKLLYGMQNACMVDYWMENRKTISWDDMLTGVGRAFYTHKAKKWFDSIKREDFMKYSKGTNNHFYYSKMYKERN